MNDTPTHIHQKQLAIFNQMSAGERVAICINMAEEGRRMVEMKIQQKHPDWTRGEVVAAAFERIYRDDFSSEELLRIADSIRRYHLRN